MSGGLCHCIWGIMVEVEHKELKRIYDPIICSMCRDNFKYFGFSPGDSINLRYISDKNQARRANYCPQDNVMEINIDSVHAFYSERKPWRVEFMILHELYHKYQCQVLVGYRQKMTIGVSAEVAESWLKNYRNYIPSLNENGKGNPEYYKQPWEFDANVYAYAVMQYKYGDVSYLKDCVPGCYGKDFYEKADEWCQRFREMGI